MAQENPDWKSDLRHGRLRTPYRHFTIFADGHAERVLVDYQCPRGRAWMSVMTWATDEEESINMIRVVGEHIGFEIDGQIEVKDAEPEQPPHEAPYLYAIEFTPYTDN